VVTVQTVQLIRCRAPEFGFSGQGWSACRRCGRGAWLHEQSNPAADLRSHAHWRVYKLDPANFPPVMRKLCV
jgi:hypothetical protein